MKFKLGIRVRPRDVILDTQGRAVEKMLQQQGEAAVQVRVGKWIELDLEAATQVEAQAKARSLASQYLVNPLIENFDVDVL